MATPSHEISLIKRSPHQNSPSLQSREVNHSARPARTLSDSDLIKQYHESISNEKFFTHMELFPRYGTTPPLFVNQFINIDNYTNHLKIPESVVIAAIQIGALMQYCSLPRLIKEHPTIPQVALDLREGRQPTIIPIIINDGLSFSLKINFIPIGSLKSLAEHFEYSPKDIEPLIKLIHSFIPDLSLDEPWFPQNDKTIFAKHKALLEFDFNVLAGIAKDFIKNPNLALSKIGFSLFSLARCCQDEPSNLKIEDWKILFEHLPRIASSCKTFLEKKAFVKSMESGFKKTHHLPEWQFLQKIQKVLQDEIVPSADVNDSKIEELLLRTLSEIKIPQYSSLLLTLSRKYIRYPHEFCSDNDFQKKIIDALLECNPGQALSLFDHLSKNSLLPPQDQLNCLTQIAAAYKKSQITIPYFSDIHRIGRYMGNLLGTEKLTIPHEIGDVALWLAQSILIDDDANTIQDALILLDNALKCKVIRGDQNSTRSFQLVLLRAMVKSPLHGNVKAATRLTRLRDDFKGLPSELDEQLNKLSVCLINSLYDEESVEGDSLAEKLLSNLESNRKNKLDLPPALIKKQLVAIVDAQIRESKVQFLVKGSQDTIGLSLEKIVRFVDAAETTDQKKYCHKIIMSYLEGLREMEAIPEKAKRLNTFCKLMSTPKFATLDFDGVLCCEIWLKISESAESMGTKQGLPLYYTSMCSALQAYQKIKQPSAGITKQMALGFKAIEGLETRSEPTFPGQFKNIVSETFQILTHQLYHKGLTKELLNVFEILLRFKEIHGILFAESEFLRKTLISEILNSSDEQSLDRIHDFLSILQKTLNFQNLPTALFQVYLQFAYVLGDMKSFQKSFNCFETVECAPQFPATRFDIETYLLNQVPKIEDPVLVQKVLQFCTKKKLVSQVKLRETCIYLCDSMIARNDLEAAVDLLTRYKNICLIPENCPVMQRHIRLLVSRLIDKRLPMHAAKILNAYSLPDTKLYHQLLQAAENSQDAKTRLRSVSEFLQASRTLPVETVDKKELVACWLIAVRMLVQDKESALIGLLEQASPLQLLLSDPSLVNISLEINLKLIEGAVTYASSKRKEPTLESYFPNLLTLRSILYPQLSTPQAVLMRTKIDNTIFLLWNRSPVIDCLEDICQMLIQHMEADTGNISDHVAITFGLAFGLSVKLAPITDSFLLTLVHMAELLQQRKASPTLMIECIESLLQFNPPQTLLIGARLFHESLCTLAATEKSPLPTKVNIHISKIFGHLVTNINDKTSRIVDDISSVIASCEHIDAKQVAIHQIMHRQRKLRKLDRLEIPPSSDVYFKLIEDLLKYLPLRSALNKVNCTVFCDILNSLIPIVEIEGFNEGQFGIDYALSLSIPKLLLLRENTPPELIQKLRNVYIKYVQTLLRDQQLIGTDTSSLYYSILTHLESMLDNHVSDNIHELIEAFIFSVEPIVTTTEYDLHHDLEDIPGNHINTSRNVAQKGIDAGIYLNHPHHFSKLNLYLLTNTHTSVVLSPKDKGVLLKEIIEDLCKKNKEAFINYALRIIRNSQLEMASTHELEIFNCYNLLLNAAKRMVPRYHLYHKLLGECLFLIREMQPLNFQLTGKICNLAILSVHQTCKDNISTENPGIVAQATLMKTVASFLYTAHLSGMFCNQDGDKRFLLLVKHLLPTLMEYDCLTKSIDVSSVLPYLLIVKPKNYQNTIFPWEDPIRLECLKIWAKHSYKLTKLPLTFNEESSVRDLINATRICLEKPNGVGRESLIRLKEVLETFLQSKLLDSQDSNKTDDTTTDPDSEIDDE